MFHQSFLIMKKIFITGVLSLLSCFKVFSPDEASALVSDSVGYTADVFERLEEKVEPEVKKIPPTSPKKSSETKVKKVRPVRKSGKSLPLIDEETIDNLHVVTWDSIMTIIKKSESLQLEAYACPAGYTTIGYGHLITSQEPYLLDGISEAQADSLLHQDLKYCRDFVQKMLHLEGNQLKAISLFCFAFGSAKLYRSTLFQKIKADEPIDDEIVKWCKLNGKPSKRLIEARELELAIYNSCP